MEVFRVLDHLGPTAKGLDDLSAWFIRIEVASFQPHWHWLNCLINQWLIRVS